MHTIYKVAKFHQTFGHPIANEPVIGTRELRELRVKLIAEELLELANALGVYVHVNNDDFAFDDRPDGYVGHCNVTGDVGDGVIVDLVEAADALGDLDYVVQGANLAFGFPAEAILDEIQASNMSKLGEDGKPIYREDGKILKGPNYFKPDIAKVLNEHSTGLYDLHTGAPAMPSIDEDTAQLLNSARLLLSFMWHGPDQPAIITPQAQAEIESQIRELELKVPKLIRDLTMRCENEKSVYVPFSELANSAYPDSPMDALRDAAEHLVDASGAIYTCTRNGNNFKVEQLLHYFGDVELAMTKLLNIFGWTHDDARIAKRVGLVKTASHKTAPPVRVDIKPQS